MMVGEIARNKETKPMSYQDDLQMLRAAAANRSADELQFTLKKLFLTLEFVRALGITAECAFRYVDTFERYHPGEIWARRMIMQIVATATAPDRAIIEQAFQHFTAPGSANFLKTMHDLYEATQKTHQREARVGYLVSAVVNAMTAELVELYFGQRPTEWESYRAQAGDFRQIALDFWTDEAVAARDIQLWLTLADAIEREFARTMG